MGIFGFRSSKDGPPPDAAFDASVAAANVESPAQATAKAVVTNEQRARFEELLVEHGLDDAMIVALAYAKRRAGSLLEAKQYVSRARARMWENCSWDPAKGPTLRIFLCGMVRSVMEGDLESAERREKTEQASLADPSASPDAPTDPESLLVAAEEQREDEREARDTIEELRREFEKKKDAVNLRWLELRAEGVEDEPAAMAACSVFSPEDYYNAQKRRIRAVARLLASRENG